MRARDYLKEKATKLNGEKSMLNKQIDRLAINVVKDVGDGALGSIE